MQRQGAQIPSYALKNICFKERKKKKGKGKLSQEESSFKKTEKQVSQQHFQNKRKIKPSFEIFENLFVLSDGIVILLKLLFF